MYSHHVWIALGLIFVSSYGLLFKTPFSECVYNFVNKLLLTRMKCSQDQTLYHNITIDILSMIFCIIAR